MSYVKKVNSGSVATAAGAAAGGRKTRGGRHFVGRNEEGFVCMPGVRAAEVKAKVRV